MSSYIKKTKNPKTGKQQIALFIDDYYVWHEYGIGFKKDGTDAIMGETKFEECDFYREEELDRENKPMKKNKWYKATATYKDQEDIMRKSVREANQEQEEIIMKFKNVYATVFQLSGYDDKQLREKENIMIQFITNKILDLKKEHNKYCDQLVEQNNMVLDKTVEEILYECIGGKKKYIGQIGGQGDMSFYKDDLMTTGWNDKRDEIIKIKEKYVK